MRSQNSFSAFILIGFSFLFFLNETPIELLQPYLGVPLILLITGIAFWLHYFRTADAASILPATILAGFGIHLLVAEKFGIWPNDTGVFLLIIALGVLLSSRKTNTGFLAGFLLLISSCLILFRDSILTAFPELASIAGAGNTHMLLIAIIALAGIVLLFKK
ncbi:MAG: hypothetical protein ACI4XL_07335 [Bacillus sp. (in: firmicutes)]